MEIKFSRHAKRRASLYGIPESTILMILQEKELTPGTHEILQRVKGLEFPLKIVFSVEDDIITIITIYPLKRGLKA